MAELSLPIPAATLILMRPGPAGDPPEILMLERTRTMAFAAGALVFPGGRIDPEDNDAAEVCAPELEDGAARIAAIRETIEESGIVPAVSPSAGPDRSAEIRQCLGLGESLPALLDRFGLALELDALTPFARWCPNFAETRRFDAFFYLAEAPPGVEASPHAPEADRIFWASANQVLADVQAGRAHAIFPTRRNLERLARFSSFAEARDDACAHPVRQITPWVEQRDGRDWLCIPEDQGYPITAEPLDRARRGLTLAG